ncbi:hypothetical protein J4430_00575 [Candidatus Woesearchaeota archaeon]|nr:hypothetical protein [Candidatus Woesearchaeota archaeon]
MTLEDQLAYTPAQQQDGGYGPQNDGYSTTHKTYSTETQSSQYGVPPPNPLEDKTIDNSYARDKGINAGNMSEHNQEHKGIKVEGCWYCSKAFSQN